MAGIQIDLTAKLTNFKEILDSLQKGLSKVDVGTALGKDLKRGIDAAIKHYEAMAKKPIVQVGNKNQLENINLQYENFAHTLTDLQNGFNSLTLDNLDFSKLIPDFDKKVKDIEEAQTALDNFKSTGFKDMISESQELETALRGIVKNFDLNKVKPDKLLEQVKNEAASTAQALAGVQEKIKNINDAIAANKATSASAANLVQYGTTAQELIPQKLQEMKDRMREGMQSLNQELGLKFSAEDQQKLIDQFFTGLTPDSIQAKFTTIKETITEEYKKAFNLDDITAQFGVQLSTDKILTALFGTSSPDFANQIKNALTVNLNTNFMENIAQQLISQTDSQRITEIFQQSGFEEAITAYVELIQQKIQQAIEVQNTAAVTIRKDEKTKESLTAREQTLTNKQTQEQSLVKTLQEKVDNYQKQVDVYQKTVADLQNQLKELKTQIGNQTLIGLKNDNTNQPPAGGFSFTEIRKYEAELEKVQKQEQLVGRLQGVIQRWFSIYTVVRMVRQAVQKVINTLKELDKTITEIAIVTNMTQKDLWGQMDSYVKLAKQYASSISGVYKVSQLYYQQGLQTADVMALTEQTLKMARISGLEYADATNYMTNAIRSFKMEMTDAQMVVDTYAAIAASSATSVKELATAMSKTASSAEAVGSSFQDTTAMMAVMIEATREAAENIGSAMKSIISRYGEMTTDPSKLVDSEGEEMSLNRVDKALQTVGISIHDAEGQFRSFTDVIVELAGKWDAIDKNTQRYIATIMAGNRQQSRFLALVSSGDRLNQLMETAANSEDASALQYLKTLDGIEAKLQQLDTAWKELYVSGGIQDFYSTLIEGATKAVDSLNDLSKLGKIPVGAIVAIGTAFYNLANIVTNVFTLIRTKISMTRKAIEAEERLARATEEVEFYNAQLQKQNALESSERKMTQIALDEAQKRKEIALQEAQQFSAAQRSKVNGSISGSGWSWGSTKQAMAVSVGTSMAALGLSAASSHYSKSNATLSGTLGAASTAATGASLGAMFGLKGAIAGAVIGGIIGIFQNASKIIRSAADKLKDLQEKALEDSNKALEARAKVVNVKKEIQDLKALEVARYNSVEAQEKYFEATKALSETYPDLISSIDEAGNITLDLDLAEVKLMQTRKDAIKAALDSADSAEAAAKKSYEIEQAEAQSALLQISGNAQYQYNTQELYGIALMHLSEQKMYQAIQNDNSDDLNKWLGVFQQISGKQLTRKALTTEDFDTQTQLLKREMTYKDGEATIWFGKSNQPILTIQHVSANTGNTLNTSDIDHATYIKASERANLQQWITAEEGLIPQLLPLTENPYLQELNNWFEDWNTTTGIASDELKKQRNALSQLRDTVHKTADATAGEKEIIDAVWETFTKELFLPIARLEDAEKLIELTNRSNAANLTSSLLSGNLQDYAQSPFAASWIQSGIITRYNQTHNTEPDFWKNHGQEEALAVESDFGVFYQALVDAGLLDAFTELYINKDNYSQSEFQDFINRLQSNPGFEYLLNLRPNLSEELNSWISTLYTNTFDRTYIEGQISKTDFKNKEELQNKFNNLLNDLGSSELAAISTFITYLNSNIKEEIMTEQQALNIAQQYSDAWEKARGAENLTQDQINQIDNIFKKADFTSIQGLIDLKIDLESIGGISQDVFDAINTILTLIPFSLENELQILTKTISDQAKDFDKTLSNASKGMDLEAAASMANLLGEDISKFQLDLTTGKYFLNGDQWQKLREKYDSIEEQYIDELERQRIQYQNVQDLNLDKVMESDDMSTQKSEVQTIITKWNKAKDADNDLTWDSFITSELEILDSVISVSKDTLSSMVIRSEIAAGQYTLALKQLGVENEDTIAQLLRGEEVGGLPSEVQVAVNQWLPFIRKTRAEAYDKFLSDLIKGIDTIGATITVDGANQEFINSIEGFGKAKVGDIISLDDLADNYYSFVIDLINNSDLLPDEKIKQLSAAESAHYKKAPMNLISQAIDSYDKLSLELAAQLASQLEIGEDKFTQDAQGNYHIDLDTLENELQEYRREHIKDMSQEDLVIYNDLMAKVTKTKNDKSNVNKLSEIISNREKLSEENVASLANLLGRDYDEVLKLLKENGDGTYSIDLSTIQKLVKNFNLDSNSAIIQLLAEQFDAIIEEMTGITENQSSGYTKISDMNKFLQKLKDNGFKNINFGDIFTWNNELNAYILTTQGIIDQIFLARRQLFTDNPDVNQTAAVQNMINKTQREMAQRISIMDFIESTDIVRATTILTQSLNDYNAFLQAAGEQYQLDTDVIIANLTQGGIGAVRAAKIIAKEQNITLSTDDLNSIYRKSINGIIEGTESLETTVGSIVSKDVADILEKAGYQIARIDSAGNALVQQVGNLVKAQASIYKALKNSNAATLQELNNAYANFINSYYGKNSFDFLEKSTSAIGYEDLSNIFTAQGKAFNSISYGELLSKNIIEHLGGGQLRILDFEAFADFLNVDKESKAYQNLLSEYRDNFIKWQTEDRDVISQEINALKDAKAGSIFNLTHFIKENNIDEELESELQSLGATINKGLIIFSQTGANNIIAILDKLAGKLDKNEYKEVFEEIKKLKAELIKNATSTIKSITSSAEGITDLDEMQSFVNEINQYTGKDFSIDAFYRYNESLNKYFLTEKGVRYKLSLAAEQLAQAGYDQESDQFKQLIEQTRLDLASQISVTDYLDATDLNKAKEQLRRSITNYNYFNKYISQFTESFNILSSDLLIRALDNGGQDAVAAAKAIAEIQGQKLSKEDIESIYRKTAEKVLEATDYLYDGIGKIVSKDAHDILAQGGYEFITLEEDSAYVIKTIGDITRAYQAIYDKLKAQGNATLGELNAAYSNIPASKSKTSEFLTLSQLSSTFSYNELADLFTNMGEVFDETVSDELKRYGILTDIGGGNLQVTNFKAFVKLLGLTDEDTQSQQYIELLTQFNNSYIDWQNAKKENIQQEILALTNAKQGSIFNVAHLNLREETIQELQKYGVLVQDGLARFVTDSSFDIINILRAIENDTQLKLPIEIKTEIEDAITNLLKGIADLINNGLQGSLNNVQAQSLITQAGNIGLTLSREQDFIQTEQGLQLSQDKAIQLYYILQKIDAVAAKTTFDALKTSLTKSGSVCQNISSTLAKINELERDINTNAGQTTAEKQRQLQLYKEIAQIQLTEPESYKFMDRNVPAGLQGPENYWNALGQAYTALNTAGQKGYMDMQDFYNITYEMQNLAAMSGKEIVFMGETLNSDIQTADDLILKAAQSLKYVNSEGQLEVDLTQFGINFKGGAAAMLKNAEDGVDSMADANIAILDGLIAMFELIVQMEELGKLDTEGNGFDLEDFFVGNAEEGYKIKSGVDTALKEWLALANSNEDFAKALEQITIGDRTIKQWFKAAIDGELSTQEEVQQFLQIVQATYNLKDYDFDPENIHSITDIFSLMGNESTPVEVQWGNENYVIYMNATFEHKDGKYWFNGKGYDKIDEVYEAYKEWQETYTETELDKIYQEKEYSFTIAGNKYNFKLEIEEIDGVYSYGNITGDSAEIVTQKWLAQELGNISEEEFTKMLEESNDNSISFSLDVLPSINVTIDAKANTTYFVGNRKYDDIEDAYKAAFVNEIDPEFLKNNIVLDDAVDQAEIVAAISFEDWYTQHELTLTPPSNTPEQTATEKNTEAITTINETVTTTNSLLQNAIDALNANTEANGGTSPTQSELESSDQESDQGTYNPDIDSVVSNQIDDAINTMQTVYDAQISGLQTQVDNLEIQKKSLETQLETAIDQKNAIEGELDRANGDLGAKQAEIIALQTQITQIETKREDDITAAASESNIEAFSLADSNGYDSEEARNKETKEQEEAYLTAQMAEAVKKTFSPADSKDDDGQKARDYDNDELLALFNSIVADYGVYPTDINRRIVFGSNREEDQSKVENGILNAIKQAFSDRASAPIWPTNDIDKRDQFLVMASLVKNAEDLQTLVQGAMNLQKNLDDATERNALQRDLNQFEKKTDVAGNVTWTGKDNAPLSNTDSALDAGTLLKDWAGAIFNTFKDLKIDINDILTEDEIYALQDAQVGAIDPDQYAVGLNALDKALQELNNQYNQVDSATSEASQSAQDLANASENANTSTSSAAGSVSALGVASSTLNARLNTTRIKVIEWGNNFNRIISSLQLPSIGGPGGVTGNVALAKGTLMGELGPELYVSNGHYFVAGQNGAEFVNLPDDAIVFNHLQTQRLLEHGHTGRGKPVSNEKKATSLAKGNIGGGPAMASASQVLASLKQIREMWKTLKDAPLSALGQKGGSGGGGGGGDEQKLDPGFIADIERWYNLTQQIEECEREITHQEKLRQKIANDLVKNGTAYYESQRKSLDALQEQIVKSEELSALQKSYFNARRKDLEQSAFRDIFTYTDEGQLEWYDDRELNNGDRSGLFALSKLYATNPDGSAVYSAREQYELLKAWGFENELKYDNSGKEIKWKDDKGKDREEAYLEAVEAWQDKLDSWKTELDDLYTSYKDQLDKVLEAENERNQILNEIRENQLTLENKLLEAIENREKELIDELQKERDAISNAADKYINGLGDRLSKEREIYSKNEENNELLRLRNQLALLQATGGSADKILNLQQQINDKTREQYFNAQQEQIDAIKEASDKQLERLDAQLKLMNETLEYEKEHGLLWAEVYKIMEKEPAEIINFLKTYTPSFKGDSSLSQDATVQDFKNIVEQWVAYRKDKEFNIGYEEAGTGWEAWAKQNKEHYQNVWDANAAAAEKAYRSEYARTSDSSQAMTEARKVFDDAMAAYFLAHPELDPKNQQIEIAETTPSIDTVKKTNSSGNSKTSTKTTVTTGTVYVQYKDIYNKLLGNQTYTKKAGTYAINSFQKGFSGYKALDTSGNITVVAGQKKDLTIYYAPTKIKHEDTPNIPGSKDAQYAQYATGGKVTATGLAILHGTKTKPEAVLNSEDYQAWKDSILTGKQVQASLSSVTQGLQTLINNSSNVSNLTNNNTDSGITIQTVELNMNASIANDYDAQRAGQNVIEEIMKVARKTGAQNIRR